MEQLRFYRDNIDSIDKEMVKLLEERFKLSLKVGLYKKENGIDILNESREKQVLEKNLDLIQDVQFKAYIEEIIKVIMSQSRKLQSNI